MTFSPTGYWANFTYIAKPVTGGGEYRNHDPRPILRWTEDGELVTVNQQLAAETPADDETDAWRSHCTVDVRPQFNPEA